MNQNIVKEILNRLSSSSPTLFKRLQLIFFGLALIILVLMFLAPLHLNLHGFEAYVNWNTLIVLLGFGGINMLPVADPKDLAKKTGDEDNLTDPNGPRGGKP